MIKAALGERVSDVRASQRLTSSASCLVAGSHGPDRELERLLARQTRARAQSRSSKSTCAIRWWRRSRARGCGADLSFLLFEQAQILDGELPEDPAAFAGRLNRLVLQGVRRAVGHEPGKMCRGRNCGTQFQTGRIRETGS